MCRAIFILKDGEGAITGEYGEVRARIEQAMKEGLIFNPIIIEGDKHYAYENGQWVETRYPGASA